LPVKKIIQGTAVKIKADAMIIPSTLRKIDHDHFVFEESAPFGDYLIPVRRAGKWYGQRFEVMTPVMAQQTDANAKDGQLLFSVGTRLPGTIEATAELQIEGVPPQKKDMLLDSRNNTELLFSLPGLRNGERQTGRLDISIQKPIKWKYTIPVDFTFLAIPYYPSNASPNTFESLPPISMNEWNKGDIPEDSHGKSPTSFKMFADSFGIHLEIRVIKDDLRLQDSWARLWKADSVQLAFDLDCDQEWEANNYFQSFNGHRVVEYAFGRCAKGKVKLAGWRHRGDAPGLKKGPVLWDLRRHVSIVRDETAKQTVYKLAIPWKYLGTPKAPDAYERLGFALLVNEKGKDDKRRVVNYFNGIYRNDPMARGKIQLVPPKLSLGLRRRNR
jgi:hypothetical protein